MRENLVIIPFQWQGTLAAGGTIKYVTSLPLTFHSGAISANTGNGGTITVQYAGTAQGTATIRSEAASVGSVYVGTAATGSAGTAHPLQIPVNGTIIITGSVATAQTQVSGYTAWFVEEFGGTAWPVKTVAV